MPTDGRVWLRRGGFQSCVREFLLVFGLALIVPETRLVLSLELLRVADIPSTPTKTCGVHLYTRDEAKRRRWAKSAASAWHVLEASNTTPRLSTGRSKQDDLPCQGRPWPSQGAFVTRMHKGTFAASDVGDYRVVNGTHRVWTENIQGTHCNVSCPERAAMVPPNATWWTLDATRPVPFLYPSSKPGVTSSFQHLLVLPNAQSYWAARSYQHAVLDLLPHVTAFVPFLIKNRHVQVVIRSAFHAFLGSLGVKREQMVDTGVCFCLRSRAVLLCTSHALTRYGFDHDLTMI
jgi:hypothetical protein